MPEVAREEFTFQSADGKTPIHVISWIPEGPAGEAPKAIVQIAHGMEEYVGRYDHFARFLAENGYVVVGNDHIGHGQSVCAPEEISQLPLDGSNIIVHDMHTLRTTFAKGFPEGTPYIMFGHSMGSFATRFYLASYGQGLAGAVICGTGQVSAGVARFGGWLARRQAKSKGVNSTSDFIYGLADGAYGKAIPNARTNLDWLNTDPAKVDEYIADPLCGVRFNMGGYATLMDLTGAACNPLCGRMMPLEVPLLLISGAEDPVGENGKGVKKAFKHVRGYVRDNVEMKLYDGMRHEILNEPEHEKVYADVLEWLEGVVEDVAYKSAIKVRLKPKSERMQQPHVVEEA